MSRHMERTTVRLDHELLEQARREARRRGQTLTALLEQGLRLVLARAGGRQIASKVKLPVSSATGGILPGVDLDDTAALADVMDGRP